MCSRKGRPRTYTVQDQPMRVHSIRMTCWHVRKAKKLGDGEVSDGVRYALELASNEKKKESVKE